MMKGKLTILLALISLVSFAQQRYISSAIIAFSGGAYERTIRDINTALEAEDALTRNEQAKAYFYRALATKQLVSSDPESEVLGPNAFLDAFNDFKLVQSLDLDEWAVRAGEEIPELGPGLKSRAKELLDLSVQARPLSRRRNLLSAALTHVNAAQTISDDFEVGLMLGRTYMGFGDVYDVEAPDRSLANYRASLRYLELALREDNECVSCVRMLVDLSGKLDDQIRVKQYTQLLSTFE